MATVFEHEKNAAGAGLRQTGSRITTRPGRLPLLAWSHRHEGRSGSYRRLGAESRHSRDRDRTAWLLAAVGIKIARMARDDRAPVCGVENALEAPATP